MRSTALPIELALNFSDLLLNTSVAQAERSKSSSKVTSEMPKPNMFKILQKFNKIKACQT